MTGSDRWSPVRIGLWTEQHRKRMGASIYLFGFLLTRANTKGIVKITYSEIVQATGIPEKTLKNWKTNLTKQGYISTKDQRGLVYQIANFRPIKKAKTGPIGRGQDWPDSVPEVAPLNPEVAPLETTTPDKPNGSPPLKRCLKDNNNIQSIFDCWNAKKIIKHRIFDNFKSAIKQSLQHYSNEEIFHAIENYAEVLKSDKCYFSHRWNLDQFLNQKNGMERFLDREACLKEFTINKNGNRYKSQAELNSASSGKLVI